MMKPLLLLAACLLAPSASFAAGESGGPALPIDIAAPKEWKVSLQFLRTKVAAGAIDNPAHKSEFVVQVLNAKGAPLVGVDVPLPKVVKGGLGSKDEPLITANLSWNAEFLADKQTMIAKTDKKGQAKGVFTSGHREEKTEIQLLGVKASIEQVWNERKGSFDYFPERVGTPTPFGYTMLFKDGDLEVPIIGHKISISPTKVEFSVSDPNDGPDGESRTVEASQKNPDEPLWKAFLAWSKWDYVVIEDKPGHYIGQYLAILPEGAVVDGMKIESINDVDYEIQDGSSFENP